MAELLLMPNQLAVGYVGGPALGDSREGEARPEAQLARPQAETGPKQSGPRRGPGQEAKVATANPKAGKVIGGFP